MSMNDEGFLSAEINGWISKKRMEHHIEFSFAGKVNKLAQHILLHMEPKIGSNFQLLVSILFARILNHYQGAIILAERGMIASARAIVRVMCDALFSLSACVADEKFIDELVKDDRHREADLIRSLLSVPNQYSGISEQMRKESAQREAVLRAEAKSDNPKKLGPYAIAKRAGLLSHYHLIYAPLSSTVHAAIRDMDTHINTDNAGKIVDLRWGPDLSGLEFVLYANIDSMLTAMSNIVTVFPQSAPLGAVDSLWQERKLMDKQEVKPA